MASLVCGDDCVWIGVGGHMVTCSPNRTEEVQHLSLADFEDKILCFAVAPCGRLLATCDDKKRLHIWNVDGKSCTVASTVTLNRKASRVIFSPDSKLILLADKNGDVYQYPTPLNTSTLYKNLVLGHLSMLLDVTLSPDSKFILTADRDEKIRVSHFPNGYNIHTYCLAHTDFVTSICIFPTDSSLLVSGSGDGTVRIWSFLKGRELACRAVRADIPAEGQHTATGEQAAVVKVRAAASLTFLVQVEDCASSLLLYQYSPAETSVETGGGSHQSSSIRMLQVLQLPSNILDFEVNEKNEVVCLTRGHQLFTFAAKAGSENYEQQHTISLEGVLDLQQQQEEEEGEGLRNLQKRWFDNMKDYLERKEVRLAAEQRKQLAAEQCEHSEEPLEKRKKMEKVCD